MRFAASVLLLLLVPVLTLPAVASARQPTQKEMIGLLLLTGGDAVCRSVLKNMEEDFGVMFMRAAPSLPKEARNVIREEVQKEAKAYVAQCVDGLAQAWRQHLTADEVEMLVKHYSTPEMRKLQELGPTVGQQTIPLQEQRGRELAERTFPRIKSRLQSEYGAKFD